MIVFKVTFDFHHVKRSHKKNSLFLMKVTFVALVEWIKTNIQNNSC